MVMRTIEIKEIAFEVEKEKQEEVIQKIKEFYPMLYITAAGDKVTVSGDLHNFKRRDMIIWILTGGKHGKNIQAN